MSKVIDSLVQTTLDSGSMTGVILTRLHFNTIYRYTNAYQSIYWDEEGSGEVEYVGTGNLGQISVLTETNEIAAQTIQVGLSGIPAQHITDIFSNDYIGQPLYIWYATLDRDTYAVEGGQYGPILLFAGRMDFGNIEFGNTATVVINATSRLADWERARGGRFNHAHQKYHVDPTDSGMRYIETIQNLPISWGGLSPSDPSQGSIEDRIRNFSDR
jgi:hypothetical protein